MRTARQLKARDRAVAAPDGEDRPLLRDGDDGAVRIRPVRREEVDLPRARVVVPFAGPVELLAHVLHAPAVPREEAVLDLRVPRLHLHDAVRDVRHVEYAVPQYLA